MLTVADDDLLDFEIVGEFGKQIWRHGRAADDQILQLAQVEVLSLGMREQIDVLGGRASHSITAVLVDGLERRQSVGEEEGKDERRLH